MTAEDRLLAAIFPTVENTPWPGVYDAHDPDQDWGEKVASAARARCLHDPFALVEAAFSCLLRAELMTTDADMMLAATVAREGLQGFLDNWKGWTYDESPEAD